MIKLSCCTVCLSTMPFEDGLDAAAELGFTRVEVIALRNNGIDLADWPAEKLADAMSTRGLEMIGLYPVPIDLRSLEQRVESNAYIRRAIDVADETGCGRLIFPPIGPNMRDTYDYAELAAECRDLAACVGDRDVRICLENHYLWPLCFAEDYARLFEQLDDPRVGACFDVGHYARTGEPHEAFIERFAGRIGHVHLKDHDADGKAVRFGEGTVPLARTVEALREAGYDGTASIETEIRNGDRVENLRHAAAYCRDTLGLS